MTVIFFHTNIDYLLTKTILTFPTLAIIFSDKVNYEDFD